MIKGSIQQDVTIVNVYTPNASSAGYLKQMLTDLKEDIDSNTIITVNNNISVSSMDRSAR